MSKAGQRQIEIGGRRIGAGSPAYVIAEISANHNQRFDAAVELVHRAKEAGADAVKLQTYTPDTITLRADQPWFKVGGGTLWDGQMLHDLYATAFTPWEWQPKLKDIANSLGLACFSSPFDPTAVDFLEAMDVPAYKIASFELVDIPLIQKVARTGKPIIMSTGMATFEEIAEAVTAARSAGAREIALLKCTSAYPAPPEEANLATIGELASRFDVVAGLSDHTLGVAVPIAAVALGAHIIEKHFTLSRAEKGPDSEFSLEPAELKAMIEGIRVAEKAVGTPSFGITPKDENSRAFRRSLFVVEDVKAGDRLTERNVRSIRPSNGLHPRHYTEVLSRTFARDAVKGTPLAWDLLK
jgi:pseudaminic acid synthase